VGEPEELGYRSSVRRR